MDMHMLEMYMLGIDMLDMDMLAKDKLDDTDIVIMSEVDEIPRAAIVSEIRACNFEATERPALLRLQGDHFWYSAHCHRVDRLWSLGPVAASGRTVRRWGPAQLRLPDFRYSGQGKGGKGSQSSSNSAAVYKPSRRGDSTEWRALVSELDLLYTSSWSDSKRSRQRLMRSDYEAGTLTTRHFMPETVPPFEVFQEDRMADVQLIPNASWHYSYFLTPNEIVLKYKSAVLGVRGIDDYATRPAEWPPDRHACIAQT